MENAKKRPINPFERAVDNSVVLIDSEKNKLVRIYFVDGWLDNGTWSDLHYINENEAIPKSMMHLFENDEEIVTYLKVKNKLR